jgi:hypothetical protein
MNHPQFKSYKRDDINSDKSWYYYCQEHQIPYIIIRPRAKFADVEFDYITFENSKIGRALRENQEYLRNRVFEIAERYKTASTKVTSAGWPLINIRNVFKKDANSVAMEIYQLVTELISLPRT